MSVAVQCLGDQQAATLGQLCTEVGSAKATYVTHLVGWLVGLDLFGRFVCVWCRCLPVAHRLGWEDVGAGTARAVSC